MKLAAGLACICFGAAGFLLLHRERRRARALAPPALAATAPPLSTAGVVAPHGHQELSLTCPTCREYGVAGASFCASDGNRLVPEAELDRGPTGGVCPVCDRGQDPGVELCPEHGEELLPVVVHRLGRAMQAEEERRICPECGASFVAGERFCIHDRHRLQELN